VKQDAQDSAGTRVSGIPGARPGAASRMPRQAPPAPADPYRERGVSSADTGRHGVRGEHTHSESPLPRPAVRRSSVRGQVLQALRTALVAGELRPGEVYSAPALGERFGVSATPVREAMQQLALEGAVEVVPNRGFRVVERCARELAELAEVRALIEVPVMLRLARTVPVERWADLRPLAEAGVRAASSGCRATYAEADRFLAPRPLLEAIRGEQPAVLLIDEVDRADEALEAVLLECLAEYQVSVPEIGTYTAKVPPYVVLTSNNTRDLSAALKRRCLHLFLDYPDAERELEIVRSKNTGLPEAAARRLVEVVRGLRDLQLRKNPSISETVDWARTLAVLGVEELAPAVLADTANVVLKYERDLHRALDVLPHLADPNRVLPPPGHHHDGHGHHPHHAGHGHQHHHDGHHHDHDQLPEVDGRAVRAAMDRQGRHDENYYGAPGPGPTRRPVPGGGQGARAFAAVTRRRTG
jgi:MoxR-like ATPase